MGRIGEKAKRFAGTTTDKPADGRVIAREPTISLVDELARATGHHGNNTLSAGIESGPLISETRGENQ